MLRRVLDQIGGRYAVTLWAWVITLPISILISSTYTSVPSLNEFLEWTLALLLIHVGLGIVMLIANFTVLPNRPRRSRPLTAIAVFGMLGAVRAYLLQIAQDIVGFGSFEISERLAFNIAICILVFSALAVIIGETKTDAAIVTRLRTARDKLTELQAQNEETLSNLDIQILREVEEQINDQLKNSNTDSAALRELSDDIVRATSHQLVRPSPATEYPRVPRTLAFREIVQRLEVPPPLVVLIPFQIAVVGFVALRYGIIFAVIDSMLGPVPSFIGLWTMRKYLQLPANPWLRITVLIVGITTIGVLATITFSAVAVFFFDDFEVSAPAVGVGLMALSLMISFWIAVVAGREDRRQQLANALDSETREIARTMPLIEERRAIASRFLHGTVQNELIAASLRGDNSQQVQARVKEIFTLYENAEAVSTAREELESLIASWSTLLTIESNIDPEIWNQLESDPARGTLLVDVVSEGLTNAVKYSTDREASIEISTNLDKVKVEVTSCGEANATGVAGIGIEDLRTRGAQIALVSSDNHTVLRTLL